MDSVKETPQDGASPGETRGGTTARSALKAAAVAAATTAGAAAARKAFSKSNSKQDGSGSRLSRVSGETISSAAQAAWEAAREHALPALEDGSRTLGRYLATDAPEIVRDVLLPPLVNAYQEARGKTGRDT